MIKTGFFNSINDDRTYKAEMFAEYFSSFIGNGIFPNPSTNLQVLADSGMNIIIKPGKAWINGYYVHNDSDYTIKLDVADGVLRRIDRVVCRLSMIDREIQILVKKGTTSRAPSPPQLIRDVEYYELAIADVLINNGATQITQANITDTRLNTALCGVVHGVVNQVDTTTIFNQYKGWFDEFSVDKEQEIQQFIDDLNALLDGDVASNLLGRLVTLENEFNTHKGESATLTAKGHVQLSNAINSTSQTLAATSYAVKQAYDLAQSAKTDGNNVKANTVSALLSVDDSLPITSSSAWTDIVTQIGNISTGKKWASGNETAVFSSGSGSFVEKRGLSFKPSIVITKNLTPNYLTEVSGFSVYVNLNVFSGTKPPTNILVMTAAGDSQQTQGNVTIYDDGFKVKVNNSNSTEKTLAWLAIE